MTLRFDIPLSGLLAAQVGMKTVQMNLANLGTVGYVRERAGLKENVAGSGAFPEVKIGSGVLVETIQRIRDMVLQKSYDNHNSLVSYFGRMESILREVETYFDTTDNRLSDRVSGFFKAWEELSKFPEESLYRYALIGETKKLTQKLNELGNALEDIKRNVKNDMEKQVGEINKILKKLAEVNKKINDLGQGVPNSLLNERDRLITELSGYLNIETSFENKNPETVTIRSGGVYLLDNETVYDIQLIENSGYQFTNGFAKIAVTSGSLKADIDGLELFIRRYQEKLDTIASKLMEDVNNIHMNGYSLSGDTGIVFFVGTNSKDIRINPLLEEAPGKIATSSVPGTAGNTDIAKRIAGLLYETFDLDMDYQTYISSFATEMAEDLNRVSMQSAIQKEILSGMEERKASIEGVNMEEEMGNLMMYQKLYAANAKVLSVVDEVYEMLFRI